MCTPPPLCDHVHRWWVAPAHVSWSSSWWLVVSHTVWVGVILGEVPSVANFLWEVALSLFCVSKPLFWLCGWCQVKFDLVRRETNLWRSAMYRQFCWRWPPAYSVLLSRQIGSGRFVCFWQCRLVVCFLAVLPGFGLWLCRQVLFQ